MMNLPVPISDEIIEYSEIVDEDSFGSKKIYLYKTQRGLLRIVFIKENLVNVAFTVNGKFADFKPWIIGDNVRKNEKN